LKGKGHEFSDVARLLNYYQQWLDNLYPRAKFADGLQLIEKAGHSKRMNVMRKEWIDEGKPGYISKESMVGKDDFEDDDLYGPGDPNTAETRPSNGTPNTSTDVARADDSLFITDSNTNRNSTANDELPEDDELDALMAEQETRQAPPPKAQAASNFDSEGEDDLDALLAEQETLGAPASTSSQTREQPPRTTPRAPQPFDDEDGDDLDALLAEQEAEALSQQPPPAQPQSVQSRSPAPKRPSGFFDDDDDEDLDDLDALLAELDARQTQQSAPRPSTAAFAAAPPTSGRDSAGHEPEASTQEPPAASNADDVQLTSLQTAAELMAKEAQDVEGEDFDAEGMFSSSPAPQDD